MWTRIGVIALVLAAVALWWWGRSDDKARADRERAGLTEEVKRTPAPEGHALDEDIGSVVEEEEEAKVPEDPIEKGPCELLLLVLDEETGQPIQTQVRLWRLDAPGNAAYQRGDQLQARVGIAKEGTVIRDLPSGDYRVRVDRQRDGEDPPSFRVHGPYTRHVVSIPVARKFEVRLRVVDETGRPTTAGRVKHILMGETQDGQPPGWVKSRRPVGPFMQIAETVGIDAVDIAGHSETEGDEYVLASMRQNTRVSRVDKMYQFGWAGGTGVGVSVDGTLSRDRTYLAVTVPLHRIRELIQVPGRGVEPRIEATCEAVVVGPTTPADAWRRVPITVKVSAAGFKTLVFHYQIDGPHRVHTLVSD